VSVGWPLLIVFGAFPVWWALGLGSFIWVIVAVPMVAWLASRPRLLVPRGFGVWIAFLGWMLISSTQLDQGSRLIPFAYRAAIYLSCTVFFVYVYNLPREDVPARRVVLVMAAFWVVVVAGGFLGLLFPKGSFSTPLEWFMPSSLVGNAFIRDLVHPRFAQLQNFVGYDVPRPAAPFTYTNAWAGNLALLTPFAIASLGVIRSYLVRNLVRLLLVGALLPIIISMNRGLWVSLGAGLAYAAIRVALRGNVRALAAIVVFLAIVAALVAYTPLGGVVQDRLAHPHSNESREELADQAIDAWVESPLLGYGGPRPSQINPNQPPIGTHGALQLVLFSHGLPGLLFFLAWFLWVFWRTRRAPSGPAFWASVVVVIGLVQSPYYNFLPSQIHIIMVAAALAWREMDAERAAVSSVGDVRSRSAPVSA
jgi:polysaccharide biosynthesis protein PslJ